MLPEHAATLARVRSAALLAMAAAAGHTVKSAANVSPPPPRRTQRPVSVARRSSGATSTPQPARTERTSVLTANELVELHGCSPKLLAAMSRVFACFERRAGRPSARPRPGDADCG